MIKGMSVARQRLRWLGRTTGVRTRSAADYCISATVSMKSDPLESPGTDPFVFRKMVKQAARNEA